MSRAERKRSSRDGGQVLAEERRTTRVAIYTRISTDEAHQPFSLEAQDLKLRAYVSSQDEWELVGSPFVDQASGATTDRKELRRVLAAARAGRFDVLLVYRVDRLSRSIRGLAQVLEELEQAGVAFRSATEPFDTSTAAGRMMVQMLGVFAEFERATIIDRVINGMERKAARGEWNGGYRSYGYDVDKDTGHYVVREDEAPLVSVIFARYVKGGVGAKAIATWLNGAGHRTKAGKPWSHEAVLTILGSRVYLGEVYYRNRWYRSADPERPFHPPLVSAELFDEVQRILEVRGEGKVNQSMTSSDYQLSGLIKCRSCGKAYVGVSVKGNRYRYRYYICFSRHRYGKATCAADRLPADQVEQGVFEALVETFADSRIVTAAVETAVASVGARLVALQGEVDLLERKIREVEGAVERYLRAFEDGSMPEAMCGARVRELAGQLTELVTRKEAVIEMIGTEPSTPSMREVEDLRRRVGEIAGLADVQGKKALMRALVHEVEVVSRERIRPYFRVPEYGLGAEGDDEKKVSPLASRQGR